MTRSKSSKEIYKTNNKSDKPDNIVEKENNIFLECEKIENQLPKCLRSYFIYLKGNILPLSRLAYLHDIKFFFDYIINETDITDASSPSDITAKDLNKITAKDINFFIDYARKYKTEINGETVIFENNNRALSRKKSSLSVMFKNLYRDNVIEKNITEGFNPIRVSKPGEREIKALQDDEVMIMLDAVTTGENLTEHEKKYWEKTKYRDKAILIIFLTYGLRLSELQQLNISSFNFNRGEFKIYRKRGKESIMPLNKSVYIVIEDYIKYERKNIKTEKESDEDALFLSLQGKRLTERAIRELVKKYTSIALKTSHKAGYSPHKLRATAATSLIGRGNSIYDVQALLDHEQVTTTQLYASHKKNVKLNLVNDMEWELERNNQDD